MDFENATVSHHAVTCRLASLAFLVLPSSLVCTFDLRPDSAPAKREEGAPANVQGKAKSCFRQRNKESRWHLSFVTCEDHVSLGRSPKKLRLEVAGASTLCCIGRAVVQAWLVCRRRHRQVATYVMNSSSRLWASKPYRPGQRALPKQVSCAGLCPTTHGSAGPCSRSTCRTDAVFVWWNMS